MASITKRISTFIACIITLYACTLLYLSQSVGNTPDHPHINFIETDEVVIMLGYKLHEDGMPTRILRHRVEKAVEVYNMLVQQNHHPLVIVSGKGKTDSEYTEAVAMQELAEWMGVRNGDILIDHDSTNTVQNALFSAKLIQHKGINEVYVVTSDYHMLRAQYIFQTVFPSNISLIFVTSQTKPEKSEKEKPVEKMHMKTAQEDFVALNILDDTESYGYHPLRNLPRWNMIEREINDDFKVSKQDSHSAEILAVDYGSNYGYFSLSLAQKFPRGTVFSLEGEAWKEYNGAADFHTKKMQELSIENNYLCRTLVAPTTFGELRNATQVYNYQLSLSVFHWFVPMNTRDVFEESLANHLLNAKTTFIELPEAMNYTGTEGQHMWKRISVWYAGRNEEQVLEGVAARYNFEVRIKTLGAILHTTGTLRKLIRVDVVNSEKANWDLQTLTTKYRCTAVQGGKANK